MVTKIGLPEHKIGYNSALYMADKSKFLYQSGSFQGWPLMTSFTLVPDRPICYDSKFLASGIQGLGTIASRGPTTLLSDKQ